MPKPTETVDQFMTTLEHPLKAEIEYVRALILAVNDQVTERIKWNAPSFCYQGDDRVTMRLHPKGRLQLVFHRGAKAKDSSTFHFDDPTGLLEWAAADRAVVTLTDMAAIKARERDLRTTVDRWMKATP